MKRLISLCVAAILLAASPAIALTGGQLKDDGEQIQKAPGSYSSGYFDGYVLGVLDLNQDRVCIAERVEMGEVLRVVLKYLQDHPEELHLRASDLVLKAIHTAWPCKR